MIVSQSEYVDSVDYAHVIGEVKNEGQQSLTSIEVTVTFYNSQGGVVATAPAFVMMEILVPGQRAPFDALTSATGLNIASYKVQISHYIQTTMNPLVTLNIKGVTSHVDSVGYIHLLGEVTNNGGSVANFTDVVVTFYNSTGGVVAVTSDFPSPAKIEAGQTSSFDALTNVNVNAITSYSAQAEANTLSLTQAPFVSPTVNGSISK